MLEDSEAIHLRNWQDGMDAGGRNSLSNFPGTKSTSPAVLCSYQCQYTMVLDSREYAFRDLPRRGPGKVACLQPL